MALLKRHSVSTTCCRNNYYYRHKLEEAETPVLGLQPPSGGENQVAVLPAGHKHPALPSRKSLPTVRATAAANAVRMGQGTMQLYQMEGCTWAPGFSSQPAPPS